MPGPMPAPGFARGPFDPMFDYRWSVIGSPLAINRYINNFLVNCHGPVGNEIVNTTYTLEAPYGWFLEADAEAIVGLSANLSANFWARGSWYSVIGNGKVESDVAETLNPALGFPPRAQAGSDNNGNATLTRSALALGLSVDVTF